MTTVTLPNESCGTLPAASDASRLTGPRRYIYCVIDCDEAAFSLDGVGPCGDSGVFAITHDGIAAVVCATSEEKLEISRGNTLAHQRVMEAAMQRGHTVLPVRFNTIAEDKGGTAAEQRIVDHVLAGRREEIRGLLSKMRPLVELGVKASWTNMNEVFREIAQTNAEIRSLRKTLLAAGGPATTGRRPARMTDQIRLGEMVKKALEKQKTDLEASLRVRLSLVAAEVRKNKTFGDPMFANLALLVDKAQQPAVEAVLSAFEARQAGAVKLRCVGPLPPSNFVELVITWDD